MSSKGLRFFGTDFNSNNFSPTITSSSASTTKQFALDNIVGTRWISNGEGTDGNGISFEVDYASNRTIDSLYVYNSNIDDITLAYWNGASYTTITTSNATITKSADGYYLFIKLNSSVSTQKVRITGDNTIVANQEKYITLFMAFLEIGQYEYFPTFSPEIRSEQNVFKLTDGRSFVIERGEQFRARIGLRSHVNQNDITLTETLLERKEPFFIWANGGDDSLFTYSFRPYRFRDIVKVTVVGSHSPSFTNNYYKSGFNTQFSIEEVV